MKKEIWKEITGHKNWFVSNKARVKNPQGGIMPLYTSSKGYINVCICGKNKRLHRIVAEAFVPNPENKLQVNHKNEDKTVNTPENLEWVTAKENTNYGNCINKRVNGRTRYAPNGAKKVVQLELGSNKIIKVWDCISDYLKQEGLNIKHSGISSCCKGKRKSFHGYGWAYLDEKPSLLIGQYDSENNLLQTFRSQREVLSYLGLSLSNNETIRACLRGEREFYHGYKWKYIEGETSLNQS